MYAAFMGEIWKYDSWRKKKFEKNTSTYIHVVMKHLFSFVKKEAKEQRKKYKTRHEMVGGNQLL